MGRFGRVAHFREVRFPLLRLLFGGRAAEDRQVHFFHQPLVVRLRRQRAGDQAGEFDIFDALRTDPGLQSILKSSLYDRNVAYTAIVDVLGRAVVHADPSLEGEVIPAAGTLESWLQRSALSLLAALYQDDTPYLETRQPLTIATTDISRRVSGAARMRPYPDVIATSGEPAS